jgi:uncharacterized protein RhaS with RHS repeats
MRARHYDPTTGRFLQPDPEGIASTQRYAFAEHNPYIYNDPTGRSSRGIGSLDRGVPSWAFEGGSLLANNSGGPFMLNDGPTLQAQTMMNAVGYNLSQSGQQIALDPDNGRAAQTMSPWEIVAAGRAAVGVVRGGVNAAAGGVAAARAARQAYVAEAQGVRTAAEKLIGGGMDPGAAARWAVDARNALKIESRQSLPGVVRWGIEQRNIWKYGNPVGPSADPLLRTRAPQAVIESSGRTNSFLNWISGAQ